MKYDKLIRDKIPAILKAESKTITTHLADDDEYWQKLKHKLKEEAAEFWHEESEEELADILEVIYAICQFKKISKEKLEQTRTKKTTERGGFGQRIILDEVAD